MMTRHKPLSHEERQRLIALPFPVFHAYGGKTWGGWTTGVDTDVMFPSGQRGRLRRGLRNIDELDSNDVYAEED